MAVTVKPQKKNLSMAEKLRLQAEAGVEEAFNNISNFSEPEKMKRIQSVAQPEAAAETYPQDEKRIETVAEKIAEAEGEKVFRKKAEESAARIDGRTTRRKNGKFVDKFTFSFPEEEKLEFKAFAAAHGITITDLIMYSLDYLKADVEEGRISLSRYGVKRLS